MTHKEWVDNEYKQWVDALNESTVYNFKDHPDVHRMLGHINDPTPFVSYLSDKQIDLIRTIDQIGRSNTSIQPITGTAWRMVYYAKKVLKQKPEAIYEIGGGCGQFFATMCALGYRGNFWIHDLTPVQAFQKKYLAEVSKQTGLDCTLRYHDHTQEDNLFCCSFYALGEFDDETKKSYLYSIKEFKHGFIIWNPHSGASKEITLECTVEDEYPLTCEGNKQLTW
jgi:hypothetical protein